MEFNTSYLHFIQNEGDIFLVFKIRAIAIPFRNYSTLHNMISKDHYPAKVMLFGEYTVLRGGLALGIPVMNFFSKWVRLSFDQSAKYFPFFRYLQLEFNTCLDTDRFLDDIQSGMTLTTSIPFGAGLGSSGNLVAAVYDRYATSRNQDLDQLRVLLATMENFFHGTSSGFDPLIILQRRALLKEQSTIRSLPKLNGHGVFPWLLDSGTSRAGNPIAKFNERIKVQEFALAVVEGTALVDGIITQWIDDGVINWDLLTALSRWQWQHLRFLIPESLHPYWQIGLDQQDFLFKFNGAGGGGMFQVWTKDDIWPGVLEVWPHQKIRTT